MKEFDNSFEPEVGKYYLVPVAKVKDVYLDKIVFIPIIGHLHKDKEFGVNHDHYHIDGRFVGNRQFSGLPISEGFTNTIIGTEVTGIRYVFIGKTTKKLKCRRNTTGVMPPKYEYAKKYWDWRETMNGAKIKNGICPHRGVRMQDKGEYLICPLHGLIGCKVKNEIIK